MPIYLQPNQQNYGKQINPIHLLLLSWESLTNYKEKELFRGQGVHF